MQKEHLYIGMSEKEWNKENSLKQEKIWQFWRKIMRKLELKQLNNERK